MRIAVIGVNHAIAVKKNSRATGHHAKLPYLRKNSNSKLLVKSCIDGRMAEQDQKALASSGIMAWLRRMALKALSAGLALLSLALVLLLVSYSALDPSVNTATPEGQAVENWLGVWGAQVASVLVNAFGWLMALLLAFIPAVWAVRLWQNRWAGRIWWRLFLLPCALILCSTALRVLPLFGVLNPNAGLFGEWLYHFLFDYAVLTMPLITLPLTAPPFVIEVQHILGVGVLILAFLGYVFVSMIGRAELQLLYRGLRGIRRLMARLMLLVLGARRTRRMKKSMRPAPPPPPRREPVFVEGEEATVAPPRPALRKSSANKPTNSPKNNQGAFDLESAGGYRLPPTDLLAEPNAQFVTSDAESLDNTSKLLESVLSEFSIGGQIERASPGPVVTRYDLNPAPGTKTQRVISLSDDIARSMSALSVRVAVVPGQNVIGIELPNQKRQTVLLRDVLDSPAWGGDAGALPLALGVDIAGKPVVADMAVMPHLLVAGTTGSGKSVGINGMILSLLYKHTPETCRFIMIDPKMLELSIYDGIPHLLTPVVTDANKAVVALKWAVREMEDRYQKMAKIGVRNIDGFNKQALEAKRKGTNLGRRVQTGFDGESGRPAFEDDPLGAGILPYIVVVIDEAADLMLVAGKDIEAAIQRLAQMARAAGIHVIMATQRPSVDIITGKIKANFPTRISFQVTSGTDSRTILSEQGAEHLLGRGDMLFMEGSGRLARVHGPFVSDEEVEAVANFLRQQGEPEYDDSVTIEPETETGNGGGGGGFDGEGSLYDQAVALVAREGKASTSFIQRHLRIGYNRAATIIEDMEKNGVVSRANHAGKREVLIERDE